MHVELLYFEGCPSHEALLPRLRGLIGELGIDAEVEMRRVETLEEAERERFLGSPTVRVDGADVEPGAGDRTDFGMTCRVYRTAQGLSGLPPDRWLRDALIPSSPGGTGGPPGSTVRP